MMSTKAQNCINIPALYRILYSVEVLSYWYHSLCCAVHNRNMVAGVTHGNCRAPLIHVTSGHSISYPVLGRVGKLLSAINLCCIFNFQLTK